MATSIRTVTTTWGVAAMTRASRLMAARMVDRAAMGSQARGARARQA
mgnify:CR=1 FL=1